MSDFPGMVIPYGQGSLSTICDAVFENLYCTVGGPPQAAGAWPIANTAFYVPIYVQLPTTVKMMGWINGTITTAPNVDVGIYDLNGVRLVSSGSTLQAGASAIQTVNITDTLLTPGVYFFAMAASGTGSQFQRSNSLSGPESRVLGIQQQATAFALPPTATFATPTTSYLPTLMASTAGTF